MKKNTVACEFNAWVLPADTSKGLRGACGSGSMGLCSLGATDPAGGVRIWGSAILGGFSAWSGAAPTSTFIPIPPGWEKPEGKESRQTGKPSLCTDTITHYDMKRRGRNSKKVKENTTYNLNAVNITALNTLVEGRGLNIHSMCERWGHERGHNNEWDSSPAWVPNWWKLVQRVTHWCTCQLYLYRSECVCVCVSKPAGCFGGPETTGLIKTTMRAGSAEAGMVCVCHSANYQQIPSQWRLKLCMQPTRVTSTNALHQCGQLLAILGQSSWLEVALLMRKEIMSCNHPQWWR